MARVDADLGPVTAVLHGAGRNAPVPLASLDEAAFHATLAPKIGGLEALLAAVDPASLKLVITFGSIIGRAGLRGQADYATANDWLTDMTRRLQAQPIKEGNPQCRYVALEWSVWSGAGMGEKLGVLESLIREGISPISLDAGIEMLRRVLATPAAPSSLVVTVSVAIPEDQPPEFGAAYAMTKAADDRMALAAGAEAASGPRCREGAHGQCRHGRRGASGGTAQPRGGVQRQGHYGHPQGGSLSAGHIHRRRHGPHHRRPARL